MEGDHSVGGHAENVESETDLHEEDSEPFQTMETSGIQSGLDLQKLVKQASKATNQSLGVTHQNQDDTFLELPTASTSVPISTTQNSHSYVTSGDHYNATSTLPGAIGSLPAVAGGIHTNPNTDHFPDLLEEQFQDDHAPSWPMSQFSDGSFGGSQQYLPESIADSEEHQIQAFAKLEFDDGEFYMNTYAVELGRDIQAARQAEERELEAEGGSGSRSRQRSASRSGSVKSANVRKGNGQSVVESVVSGSGGVIADHHKSETGKKEKRKKSKSWSSSSRQLSRKSSMQSQVPRTDYNALAMASLMGSSPGRNGFGIGRPLPSPDLTPLIPIHPPAPLEGVTMSHKSISRKHIRIAFNFEEHLFQVEILGRNGGFVDEIYYAQGKTVSLVNGSIIQIGGVGVRFVLPDVPRGETGAELGMGSDPLSGVVTSFEMADSSREESQEAEVEADGEDDTAAVKREEEEEPEVSRTRGKGKKKAEAPPPPPPKRKGPGRPPKNGIISKREQALLAKQAKEEAKAKAEGRSVAPIDREKGKDGKDTKGPKPEETSVQPNGKRKYTKRKRAGGTEDQQAVRDSTEHTDSVPPEQGMAVVLPPKPPKEKKPAKPPKSPSPVFDESKMTPEQLAKPQSSYVVLIHEALTNSKTGQMSLPQIYRAIERRYPFYKLRVQTQGWQSSVRHNLSQHPAFRKIERDGKGWMWGLVPEVSIEKEKKRRATPPPASQQHYYPPNPMMQHPYPYPGITPPNGHLPPAPYGPYPGMPPGRMPYPAPPPRPGFPLPLVSAQSESTYRSPYQPTPPPAPTQSTPQPQQSSATNGTNGYYPTPVSQPPAESSNNNQPFADNNIPPSSHPPAASSTNGSHEQDVNQAVSKFKTALISNMDDKVRGEKIVNSAINRVLSIQANSNLPSEEEDPNETTVRNIFSKMLGDLNQKNTEAKKPDSDSNPPTTNAHSLPEPKAQDSESLNATAIAAVKAAKIALTNGESAPSAVNGKDAAQELNGGTKRPLENGNRTSAGDTGQPEAKRVASGTVKA